MDRYEYIDERSRKFWQWAVDGANLIVEYGRIGSAGQRKVSAFATTDEAKNAAHRLVLEKCRKGYLLVDKETAASPSPIPTPRSAAAALSSVEVAMILIEHVEKVSCAELLPIDPDRAAFVERWPSTPRTLVELWDLCGGEKSNVLFVLARAAMRSFPAAEEWGSQIGYISTMMLENPGSVLWQAINSPWDDERVRPSWVQVANGGNDILFVDEQGAALVWSRNIDSPVMKVHPSFDAWMLETAIALRDGVVRIAPLSDRPAPGDPPGSLGPGEPVDERVIRGSFSYEFGNGEWWDGKRQRQL